LSPILSPTVPTEEKILKKILSKPIMLTKLTAHANSQLYAHASEKIALF